MCARATDLDVGVYGGRLMTRLTSLGVRAESAWLSSQVWGHKASCSLDA